LCKAFSVDREKRRRNSLAEEAARREKRSADKSHSSRRTVKVSLMLWAAIYEREGSLATKLLCWSRIQPLTVAVYLKFPPKHVVFRSTTAHSPRRPHQVLISTRIECFSSLTCRRAYRSILRRLCSSSTSLSPRNSFIRQDERL
jgi:hypothetical protein